MDDSLHMTVTGYDLGDFWVACRCGWEAHNFYTLGQARQAGDQHLAVANGNG